MLLSGSPGVASTSGNALSRLKAITKSDKGLSWDFRGSVMSSYGGFTDEQIADAQIAEWHESELELRLSHRCTRSSRSRSICDGFGIRGSVSGRLAVGGPLGQRAVGCLCLGHHFYHRGAVRRG